MDPDIRDTRDGLEYDIFYLGRNCMSLGARSGCRSPPRADPRNSRLVNSHEDTTLEPIILGRLLIDAEYISTWVTEDGGNLRRLHP